MNTEPELSKHKGSRMTSIVLAAVGLLMVILAIIMDLSDNLPAILLLIVGLCLIIYSFVYQSGKQSKLSTPLKLLYWTPRILSIVFIMFSSLFALDVFDEVTSIGEIIINLFMHLIPQFILIIILVITWRREWIGGILFSVFGLLYIGLNWGRFPWMTYTIVAGPLIIIGIFFLLNWKYRTDLRPDKKEESMIN